MRIRSEQKSGNVDLLLSVIFGENMRIYQKKSSFSKEAVFPELIRSDFPLGMNLSRIKRGEPVSDTILRKTFQGHRQIVIHTFAQDELSHIQYAGAEA